MTRAARIPGLALAAWALAAAAWTAGAVEETAAFTPYPGAERIRVSDEPASGRALRTVTREETYVTTEAYDRVCEFYRQRCRETNPMLRTLQPKQAGKYELRYTFFTLDGAASFLNSGHWIKVQHPYIGQAVNQGGQITYKNVKNLTVITVTRKERAPGTQPKAGVGGTLGPGAE